MCRKRSASCVGVFLFDRCLGMCLHKGSVLCICRSACSISSVSGFGMTSGVSVTLVISGVTIFVIGCRVRSSVMLHWAVLLLVWNVGPSWLVTDNIWTVACLSCGSSTSLERQSAALFQAPDIHSKVCYMLLVLILICLPCCSHFPLRNLASGCDHWV